LRQLSVLSWFEAGRGMCFPTQAFGLDGAPSEQSGAGGVSRASRVFAELVEVVLSQPQ
jgi:hypothetical protein